MSAALQPDNVREKGRLKKWQPRRWRVEYTKVVGLSVLGMSNVAIAEKVGFTKEYVSVILNLPEAINLYDRLAEKIKLSQEDSIADNLNYVAKKTAARLRALVDDDEKFEKNPFAVIDRGMDVLKGLRHLTGGGNGSIGVGEPGAITNIGTVIINPNQVSEITTGLEKLQEIKQLHGKAGEIK